ncbi:DinB family protein [Algivirga pacifica]|uniref:DinB family protein n=1 Tax=Algivirga pacifica TaxID=1162670 RepID=A0ABP9D8U3_9BACT
MDHQVIREHIVRLLSWEEAHVGFESTIEDIPEELRGKTVENFPHSLWQLLEHIRICQWDILDFCINPEYQEMEWPKDYWPTSPTPPSSQAWDESIRQVLADREALKQLAVDPQVDLTSEIPHGDGQTYYRELLLVADHNAYHVGQLAMLRRLLGIWDS